MGVTGELATIVLSGDKVTFGPRSDAQPGAAAEIAVNRIAPKDVDKARNRLPLTAIHTTLLASNDRRALHPVCCASAGRL